MAKRKTKRRNSEKRKEKSRDAARYRRTKECEVFQDLLDALPLPQSQTSQLDKASVIRLGISHLKLRKLLGHDGGFQQTELQKKLNMQYSKVLDGFVLILTRDGDIMFLSDSVSKYLGITQIELIGQSIYDFTHPCDHDEIREILLAKIGDPLEGKHLCSFLMRMKCTLTSKGRNVNLKSANYRVVRCSGRYVTSRTASRQFIGLLEDPRSMCLMLIAELIPHPSNIEVMLDRSTFVSKHSLDMKFTSCDQRVEELLGYDRQRLLGTSVFQYHHASDSESIRTAFRDLYSKGQAVIVNYRFLANGGGHCYMETQATLIHNPRTDKPQSVVCINYVISEVMERDVLMSGVQQESYEMTLEQPGMLLSTESVFAPISDPCDDEFDMLQITTADGKEQMLTDLMELAPSAGPILMDLPNPCVMPYSEESLTPPSYYDTSRSPQQVPVQASDMTVLDLSYLNKADSSMSGASSVTRSLSNSPSNSSLIDDMDFDLRAPFIPMDGFDDQLFSQNWIPRQDAEMEARCMLGTTETVFEQIPEPEIKGNTRRPQSILRLEAHQKTNFPPQGGEIARNAGPPKMKRPMETNRLETGPPKIMKLTRALGEDSSIGSTSKQIPDIHDILTDVPASKGSSVLKNLLTSGIDNNHGYSIKPKTSTLAQMFGNDGTNLRELLEMYTDDDSDSDVIDLDSDEDSGNSAVDSSPGGLGKAILSGVTAPYTITKPSVVPTATVTSSTAAPPTASPQNRPNLVVIRTNKGLLFAPIPTASGASSQGIMSVRYNN